MQFLPFVTMPARENAGEDLAMSSYDDTEYRISNDDPLAIAKGACWALVITLAMLLAVWGCWP
jgi:hypothetical protein